MSKSYIYRGYEPWNLEKFLKTESGHHWKSSGKMKKNRPVCGARCRDGHPCKAKAVVNTINDKPINGRCRMHGGLSSGAKTVEGKQRCREAAKRGMAEYWKRKKLAQVNE